MKIFSQKRFVYQQAPQQQTGEIQVQPPVETGKEALPPTVEIGKEALPTDPNKISNDYKEKAKLNVGSANDKLSIFANLQPGVDKPVQPS